MMAPTLALSLRWILTLFLVELEVLVAVKTGAVGCVGAGFRSSFLDSGVERVSIFGGSGLSFLNRVSLMVPILAMKATKPTRKRPMATQLDFRVSGVMEDSGKRLTRSSRALRILLYSRLRSSVGVRSKRRCFSFCWKRADSCKTSL